MGAVSKRFDWGMARPGRNLHNSPRSDVAPRVGEYYKTSEVSEDLGGLGKSARCQASPHEFEV